MKIYLDNAATTPLDTEVYKAMEPYLLEFYGNPSSAHSYGREVKRAIEDARATVAGFLNADPENIFFTSGGTESDNTAICSAIRTAGIRLAITTRFEHHAVLNTLRFLEEKGEIEVIFLNHDQQGNLSLAHLEQTLSLNGKALVSVMHGNNEIGNLNDIGAIAEICGRFGAVFHTDTVQTMGHYRYDVRSLKADFIVGSGHKFHGPKGTGFLYSSNRCGIHQLINGGGQENNRRAGTENVAGIIGLSKALEVAYRDLDADNFKMNRLKFRMIGRLSAKLPGIRFNGNCADADKSMPGVLSVSLPAYSEWSSVLSYLDNNSIYASGGSACTSHEHGGSHVLRALDYDFSRPVIRFSFSRLNTESEIDHVTDRLEQFFSGRYEPQRLVC